MSIWDNETETPVEKIVKTSSKPVLFTEDYAQRFDPSNVRVSDPSRIGGWSETVQANDIEIADDLDFRKAHQSAKVIKTKEDAYRVIGSGPSKLPIEFKWLQVNGPGGANSPNANAQIDMYTSDQGFLLCTKDKFDVMIENYGYEFNHARWRVAEDGSIRRGYDVALYYRSGDVARKWEQHLAAQAAGKISTSLPSQIQGDTGFSEEEVEEILITH